MKFRRRRPMLRAMLMALFPFTNPTTWATALGRNRHKHVYMVRQQMPFLNTAFLLTSQFVEHLPQFPPQLAIQNLPPALRDPHQMILALPYGVPQPSNVVISEPSFLSNFERFTERKALFYSRKRQTLESPGRAGGLPKVVSTGRPGRFRWRSAGGLRILARGSRWSHSTAMPAEILTTKWGPGVPDAAIP